MTALGLTCASIALACAAVFSATAACLLDRWNPLRFGLLAWFFTAFVGLVDIAIGAWVLR
jgi:hypothetical protein